MANLVIVGGGISGLAAALFSARRGHTVTVLERDGPPPTDHGADHDVAAWDRPGVPHVRQGHVFLGLSTRVLREEAPDVLVEMVARGAVEVPLETTAEESNLLARRQVYEATLRRAVEAEAGVTMLPRTTVAGFRASGTIAGVPRLSGVRAKDGALISADLILDASGRHSQVHRWLALATGSRRLTQRASPCQIWYVTQHYRLKPDAIFPNVNVPIGVELDYATVLAFPGDNSHFQLSVILAAGDPLRHRLRDPHILQRFFSEVPGIDEWIRRGQADGTPLVMGGLENRHRQVVADGQPVVAGLALLADAAVQTNPAFARGVSLGFLHAQHLADTLEQVGPDPLAYVREFERWTRRHLVPWFDFQVKVDDARINHWANGGREAPTAVHHLASPGRLASAMLSLRDTDDLVRKASIELLNLLRSPSDLLADRQLAGRLLQHLRTHPDQAPPRVGPTRDSFERMVLGPH